MKNQKNNRKSAWILLTVACVFVAFYLGGVVKNCSGSEQNTENKWIAPKADDSYVTGETAENTQSVAEANEFTAERPSNVAGSSEEGPSEGLSQRVYEMLEQPAPIAGKKEMILMKSAFIISYNVNTLCPNYVAWKLTASRTEGEARRTDEYIPDPSLSQAMQVLSSDFSGSGYDRGHMCPAGDNKNDQRAMDESFMMTNICPQSHSLNSGWWNDLEIKCREWAKDGNDLYIVAGPIFDTASPKKIGKRKGNKIAVPDRFFKVILMLGNNPKAIGFVVPNLDLKDNLRKYAMPVDRVEKITGIDFYPQLSDGLQRRVEKNCKVEEWGI